MTGFSGQIPVYRQIMQRIQADVGNGTLHSGDRLPSVRELSEQMTVNPNTMQRAMTELERAGVVIIRRGVGAFVSEDPELPRRLRDTQATACTRRYVRQMKVLGIPGDEVLGLVRRGMEESAAGPASPPGSHAEGAMNVQGAMKEEDS